MHADADRVLRHLKMRLTAAINECDIALDDDRADQHAAAFAHLRDLVHATRTRPGYRPEVRRETGDLGGAFAFIGISETRSLLGVAESFVSLMIDIPSAVTPRSTKALDRILDQVVGILDSGSAIEDLRRGIS